MICPKCGGKLNEGAIFCRVCGEKCGHDAPLPETQSAEQAPGKNLGTQPVAAIEQVALQQLAKPKKSPLLIIIPIIGVVLIAAAILFIVVTSSNNKIIKKSGDDTVFNFTAREYIDALNKTGHFDFEYSDFEHDENNSGYDLYMGPDDSFIVILFTEESSLDSNVIEIKFCNDTYDEEELPDGMIYGVKAVYQWLSTDQAKEMVEKGWYIDDNIRITSEYDDYYEYQSWYIYPRTL